MTNIKFLTKHIVFSLLLIVCELMMSSHAFSTNYQQLPEDTVTHQKYEKSKQPTFNQQDRFGDPFSNTQSPSPLLLEDPASLQLELEIDTAMNYTIFERIGALNYRPRSTMSFQEFNKYQDQRMKKDYWQNRSSGLDGESAVSGRRLIPKLYISPVFDRIFGGSYVDLQPNGFVNLDFGGRWQKTENPATPVNQQRNGGFNFDQQISMNLVGKVGEKLAVTANFDNNNSFDYKNNMKIEYTGYAEDIIKKIEIGNVSMSVPNSLMTGGQNLFGIKTQLQFGKLFVTALASRQQGSVKSVSPDRNSTGLNFAGGDGSGTGAFDKRATDYDDNRHFFLGHFFRDHYEEWLSQLPRVVSGVNIITLEVYVVRRPGETATLRSMAAFLDLGESDTLHNAAWKQQSGAAASNGVNGLWDKISNDDLLRNDSSLVTQLSESGEYGMVKGEDFENQRAKKLDINDYSFNEQLGYLSLNSTLNSDEFLAVAYQYTYRGQSYTVGELSSDYSGKPDEYVVFLKMLKPNSNNPDLESWDLKMKNIYDLGGRGMEEDGFELRINYRDDTKNYNAPSLNEGTNTINTPLIEVMGLDQLNVSGDNQKDGKFDYITDVTVDEDNGNIIFPVLEPFGSHLEKQFTSDETDLKNTYVFHELYDNIPAVAETFTNKNKFSIYGVNPSSSSSEITLPAFNIEKGSVVVSNDSEILIEGTHFSVDYNTGKVTLMNRPDLNVNDLTINFEQQDLFSGIQSKWLTGVRLDYQFSDKINLGATVFHVKERARGVSHYAIGQEPINNIKYGFDANYDQPSRILTKAIDALPLISTKEESRVTVSGEFAQLRPGTTNVDGSGESISFIEDFENAVTERAFGGGHAPWSLGSVPSRFRGGDGLASGKYRAKMAWYIVDRSLYTVGTQPDNLSDEDLSGHYERAVFPQEVFPGQELQQINSNLSIFDIAYYPNDRGPYNYNNSSSDLDQDGSFIRPEDNFGAITREMVGQTDFTSSNIEYIEFWMMDPFIDGERGRRRVTGEETDVVVSEQGELVFNVGNISEDILDNDQWEFENGLPADGSNDNTNSTEWGRVTTISQVTTFFDTESTARENQDVGLDGINSDQEHDKFFDSLFAVSSGFRASPERLTALSSDPASDDFEYYLGSNHDDNDANILERYKNFNGVEGNSPISAGTENYIASATIVPDTEDINADLNFNTTDAYREFRVKLTKGMDVGDGYIVDKVTDATGEADWFQFRIPFSDSNAEDIGNYSLSDNRMIRMYMTGWKKPVVLRMASLSMVGSQWRRSTLSLTDRGFDVVPEPSTAGFELSVVNIEENSTSSGGKPPYIVPLERDQDNSTTLSRQINEQALKLCVEDLEDGDSRGVFKELNQSIINYERIKMFFHAEQELDATTEYLEGEVSAFLRLGIDQTENYYEIEVPLIITPNGLASYSLTDVWPEANEIDLALDELRDLKKERNSTDQSVLSPFSGSSSDGKYKLSIIGNPELSNVITMMVGITNPKAEENEENDDKSVCIWANEIRVSGYNVDNGWAANASMSVKLADLATLKGSVSYKSAGFGGIQDNAASLGTDNFLDYDLSMDMAVDKLIPWNTGIKIPMRVGYSKSTTTPTLDPLQNDMPLDVVLDQIEDADEREAYKKIVETSSVGKNISFNNVHKEKVKKDAKSHIYDIENLSFTYTYNETLNKSITTVEDIRKNYAGNVNYSYNPQVAPFEPFKNAEFLSSPYLKFIKDLNFSPLPSSISVTANMDRRYKKVQLRNYELNTIGVIPTFEKSFNFNRNYNLRWNVFKSLNLNYNATVGAIIDEPEGEIDTQAKRDSIWSNVMRLGRMKNFNQSVSATYRLPFDKFPMTEWMSADYRYDVNYGWLAGNLGQVELYGNEINNSRTQDITGKFDLVQLYNKNKFLKSINTPARKRASTTRSRQPAKVDTTKAKPTVPMLKGLFRLLMTVRSINVTVGRRESTTLPGFTMDPYLFGLSEGFEAPGAAFVFGDQDPDIRIRAGDNGWIVKNSEQYDNFTQSLTNDISIRANLEPFKDVKIQVDMKRSDQSAYAEVYNWSDSLGDFRSTIPNRSGSYSMSFLPIRTAFVKGNKDNSHDVFSQFESNISLIENRLSQRGLGLEYAENSQDAIIPAFIAAYMGSNASSVNLSPVPKLPMPNWRIDYAGLSKLPVLKEIFSSVNITHAYISSFSIANYQSDLTYTNPEDLDLSNSILDYPLATQAGSNGQSLTPVYIISQVSVIERFSPLIGINVRTKNKITTKVEWKKERSLNLNISNSELTEQVSDDVAFDFGITKSKMKMPFKIQGRSVALENDIQFRTTFTIRNTRTVQRKIDDVQTVTEGNLGCQFRPNLTYVANKKLNITMYYERNINQPKVSSSFNRSSASFGIQMRFSLAQ